MNYKRLLFLLAAIFLSLGLQAQSKGFNFQAVARSSSGAILDNQSVNLTFSILEGSSSGTAVYVETQSLNTNDYGLFAAVVGEGTPTSGNFSSIDWASNDYFLEVELDGSPVATTELVAVPYSKVATDMDINHLNDVNASSPSSGDMLGYDGSNWVPSSGAMSLWDSSGSDVYYNSGFVGIGTNNPSKALTIEGSFNDGDIRLEDDFPIIFANTTTGSGNSGLIFEDNGLQSGFVLHSGSDDAVIIQGENTSAVNENLVVANTGMVGVGTASPERNLEVFADDSAFAQITNNGTQPHGFRLKKEGGSNYQYRDFEIVTGNGDMSILASDDNYSSYEMALNIDWDAFSTIRSIEFGGDVSPLIDNTYDLGSSAYSWDDVYATNGVIITSDAREKTGIESLQYGLDELLQLNPVNYQWKDEPEGETKLGLIAQELEQVIPEVVAAPKPSEITNEEGEKAGGSERYGVYYTELIPVLIKSIQEQQEEISALEDRINELENR